MIFLPGAEKRARRPRISEALVAATRVQREKYPHAFRASGSGVRRFLGGRVGRWAGGRVGGWVGWPGGLGGWGWEEVARGWLRCSGPSIVELKEGGEIKRPLISR